MEYKSETPDRFGENEKKSDPEERSNAALGSDETLGRLKTLVDEVEVVKMNSLKRIIEEMNLPPGEPQRDVQKESQTVMKAVEIQHRLWTDRQRQKGSEMSEPGLEDIWQALIDLPQVGAVLRRDSVRARLVEALKKSAGEA